MTKKRKKQRRALSTQFDPEKYISNNCEVSYDDLPDDPLIINVTPPAWKGGIFKDMDELSNRRQLTVEDHIELD